MPVQKSQDQPELQGYPLQNALGRISRHRAHAPSPRRHAHLAQARLRRGRLHTPRAARPRDGRDRHGLDTHRRVPRRALPGRAEALPVRRRASRGGAVRRVVRGERGRRLATELLGAGAVGDVSGAESAERGVL